MGRIAALFFFASIVAAFSALVAPAISSVHADRSIEWFPAVDPGVVLWSDAGDSDDEKSFGLGLGGHIVTYKIRNDTRFDPAFTLHVGSRIHQMFAGVLSTQAGDVTSGRSKSRESRRRARVGLRLRAWPAVDDSELPRRRHDRGAQHEGQQMNTVECVMAAGGLAAAGR